MCVLDRIWSYSMIELKMGEFDCWISDRRRKNLSCVSISFTWFKKKAYWLSLREKRYFERESEYWFYVIYIVINLSYQFKDSKNLSFFRKTFDIALFFDPTKVTRTLKSKFLSFKMLKLSPCCCLECGKITGNLRKSIFPFRFHFLRFPCIFAITYYIH